MKASSSARSPTSLGRLVDKSLVVAEEEADGYRYRLLEPMRQYARERLVEAGEAATVEARHLAFYLELARAADPEGAAAGPLVGLDRLEADHDNLRAALAWALRHEPEQALALAVHMWPMWMAGSHFQEGSRWLDAALAAAPAPTELRAEALRAACGLRDPPGADGRAQRARRRAGRDLPGAGRPRRRRPRARRGRGL